MEISIEHEFQRRMIEIDIYKKLFEIIEKNKSDYLMIDLIEERFPLVNIYGTFITASNEALRGIKNIDNYDLIYKQIEKDQLIYEYIVPGLLGRYKKNNQHKKRLLREIKRIDVKEYICTFCKRILSEYKGQHIILHKAFFANTYLDKTGNIKEFEEVQIKKNKNINEILGFMYDLFIEYIPNINIIDESVNACADESHRWGLAPMHYEEKYYIRVMKHLDEITGNM